MQVPSWHQGCMFLTLTVSPQIHSEAVHKMWRQIAIWCTDADCQNKSWLNKLWILRFSCCRACLGSDRISVQEEGLRRSRSLLWFVVQNRLFAQCLCRCSESHHENGKRFHSETWHTAHGWTWVISGASGFKLHKLWIGQLGVNSSARSSGTGSTFGILSMMAMWPWMWRATN